MKIENMNMNKSMWQPAAGSTILAQGVSIPFNDYTSGLNDNILVVGGSGTGKTRGIVRPNLLQATGSYIVSDPKGNLYDQYAAYLRAHGYRVGRLDLLDPNKSTLHYNPIAHIQCEMDVLKLAHLMGQIKPTGCKGDPFWQDSSELLLEGLIGYVWEAMPTSKQTLATVLELLRKCRRSDSDNCPFDENIKSLKERNPDSLAVKCYENVATAPYRTWESILVSIAAMYSCYETKEITDLMRCDTVRMEGIGYRPTALFVVVSDTDRTMDTIANMFFSQVLQVLCREADARPDSRLPVPVRFILDDFATNVRIDQFPRMISSFRSRGISTMLMVQAEAQLEAGYGNDAGTIIGNCDQYLYLGGNDIDTARRVGERCDLPMLEILNMPVRSCWIFRRGQAAMRGEIFDLDTFEGIKRGEVAAELEFAEEPETIGERRMRHEGIAAKKRMAHLNEPYDGPVAYVRNAQFTA